MPCNAWQGQEKMTDNLGHDCFGVILNYCDKTRSLALALHFNFLVHTKYRAMARVGRSVERTRVRRTCSSLCLLRGHWARVNGHNGACHRSGNLTVQRAPGVRSTLKLPPSRCASALTNPRPDKRLLGSSKSKPNPSSCTQSSYSPGRRLKLTVTVTCPYWLPPYFTAFISSSLMINASGMAVSFGTFPLAVLQSIDTSLPNRVRALAQIALTRSCPFTSVEPRAQ